MRVVLRLQNHGYKNHPHWYIVAAGKYKKVQGKYIEHLGYWIPRKGKTFDRSIILNKKRIQYWLAQGAQPTEKVSKFLNNVDMWPKPVTKFGSKSIYEKPQKKGNDAHNLNPYNLGPLQQFLGQVLEQEQTSYIFRLAIQNSNQLQSFEGKYGDLTELNKMSQDEQKNSDSVSGIEKEIKQLKEQLNEINATNLKLDSSRQQLLINRINELYKVWHRESVRQEYSQLQVTNEFNSEVTEKNIKQELDWQKLDRKLIELKKTAETNQQLLKPISKDEFKRYLIQHGEMTETKAETMTRQAFRVSRDQGLQVIRQHAVEACQPDIDIEHILDITSKKYMTEDQKVFIPITKPVTPFPDLKTYDPEDYYEIPKMVDPLREQNRAYDLPNINDVHVPKKVPKERTTKRNVSGRKRPQRLKTRLLSTHLYEDEGVQMPYSALNIWKIMQQSE